MQPNNSQYDFILKGDKQDTGKPQQQSVSGKFFLPKKAIIGIVAGFFLILIGFIVISSLGKKDSGADQLVAIMATAGDIARVSDLVNDKTKDASANSLSATTSAALTSEQSQVSKYLAEAGVKYDPKKLAIYTDTKIEAQLTTAEQNNALETTYYAYLKEKLTSHQNLIQQLGASASGPLRSLLEAIFISIQNLLAAPQLKQ